MQTSKAFNLRQLRGFILIDHDGTGKRIMISIFDENYYVTGTRADDDGIDFTPTVPRENDPAMSRERQAIEVICLELSRLTRMV